MVRFVAFFLCCLFLSCSSHDDVNYELKKEFYNSGKLKSITYQFKDDDLKKVEYTPHGGLDYITHISRKGLDKNVFVFDDKGKLWMILPYIEDSLHGKVIYFDDSGIDKIEEYENGKFIE